MDQQERGLAEFLAYPTYGLLRPAKPSKLKNVRIRTLGKSPIPFEISPDNGDYTRLLAFQQSGNRRHLSAIVPRENKPERNSPCHCGSGIKFKKCCGK